jgi:hypothetical protein
MAGDFFSGCTMEISTICRQDEAFSLPRLSPDRAWPGFKKQLCRMRVPAVLACPTRASGLAKRAEKNYFAIQLEA